MAISLKAFSTASSVIDDSSPHFFTSIRWNFGASKTAVTAIAGSSAELFCSFS